jgi:TRAP-type C4-dicarboxylate transport system permease small subunit
MKRLIAGIEQLDIFFISISGVVLAFMMVVTLADVIMRTLGKPIVGSIEIITFSGAVVVGFSIPYTSWKKSHVYVDFLIERLSPFPKRIMQSATLSAGILLFLFIGYNFILYGLDLKRTGEVSPGLKIPFYPIPFGLAVASFLESLTLFCQLTTEIKGGDR